MDVDDDDDGSRNRFNERDNTRLYTHEDPNSICKTTMALPASSARCSLDHKHLNHLGGNTSLEPPAYRSLSSPDAFRWLDPSCLVYGVGSGRSCAVAAARLSSACRKLFDEYAAEGGPLSRQA